MSFKRVNFKNNKGHELSGRIEFPIDRKPLAYVVFAHVFTGNKNLIAAKYISQALVQNGFALLRFDFTGLGQSEGDFAETNFSSNIDDIIAAAQFLADEYEAPKILIGQSLGGAASIFAADKLESVKAVATIGTPSMPEHVMHLFGCSAEDIEKYGEAELEIQGRVFKIQKHFVDDIKNHDMSSVIRQLGKALLIMHSPQDRIVAIEHAANLYHAAFHPKSFVTLDNADHMLSNKNDAHYAGALISAWVKRYIDKPEPRELKSHKQVVARLGAEGFTTDIKIDRHSLIADEPHEVGGDDFGPSPYELLASSLAACKAMTLQMYARRKKWDLQELSVHVSYDRRYMDDCTDCEKSDKKLEFFDTEFEFVGDLDEEQKARLIEIAGKCPVHRTITGNPKFTSKLID